VGEGEATLLEVMNVLKGHKKEGGIPGAIFSHRLLTHYEARKPIQDLNVIPWPTFKEFNLRQYHTSSIPLFSSRGCIGKCNFCNDWSLSLPYRFRDARNIFEEIKYHVKNNHTHSFSFKDLLCNGDIPNLNLLLDLIIQSGLAISWDSQAIARKEMTYGLLCKMQQAGCHTLVYGIESFSNNVLKRMGKIFTSQIAEEVLKNTCQAGIRSFVNIIVGFPGETDEDFQETLRALERNGRYIESIGAVSVCLVNHNSDLENNFQRYDLVLSEDVNKRAKEWTCSSSRNDYLLRQEKARQVLSIMDKMGLKYETLTI
jgi:radical SAM superfamily enzyme YgiQ (UPF0313 family)